MDERMNKENEVKNRVLFSHKKEGNSVIGYNMDEPSSHYVK